MEEVETNGSKNNGGRGQCALATFVFSWFLLVLITALSLACTWAYSQQYDKSGTGLSVAAAILTSIAICGATFGACGCGTGGSEAKMGIGFLWQCYHECDDDCDICVCFRLLALCGLTVIIVPSFGIFQVISGSLMLRSLVINTATNVKVFAGFIAVFDFFAAIFGVITSCFLCSSACAD